MATAISGKGGFFDARPSGEHRNGLTGPFGGVAGSVKDACQGACSGMLTLLGATHLTGAPSGFSAAGSQFEGLDAIWRVLSDIGLAGPIELMGGVALFFAARRTISRTLGLLAFVAFVTAQASGYSTGDMLAVLSNLLQQAAGFIDSIPVTETAA